jgi:hypothetical protein
MKTFLDSNREWNLRASVGHAETRGKGFQSGSDLCGSPALPAWSPHAMFQQRCGRVLACRSMPR